ncbi:MAG: glycosyltransferase family 2 protein [Gammaproteobacteria bacterium]|nr:glycosyltransferase family 2 protein [Gammaproteobacteria bacterium]
MITLFWVSLAAIFYAYFGYPLILVILGKLKDIFSPEVHETYPEDSAPDITIIIPAHNEEQVIEAKIRNTLSLYYPGKIQVLVVSDGSSDNTVSITNKFIDDKRLFLLELTERSGKAQALNRALKEVTGDIVIFSDASILLEEKSVWEIVQPFTDKNIGCVSGEDIIEEAGGEGLYGLYELFLRNQESKIGSIVGASGSFYAQRTHLIDPFLEGLAPDFLSVMNTVEKGYRVISYSPARGTMTAVQSSKDEFQRKVRTLIRGMTALFKKTNLLNPFNNPLFSLFLWSHKIMRWLVPFFLLFTLLSSVVLIDNLFYEIMLYLQLAFYLIALMGALGVEKVLDTIPGKIALYFTSVNVAIAIAWFKYFTGVRQELWIPSKRK